MKLHTFAFYLSRERVPWRDAFMMWLVSHGKELSEAVPRKAYRGFVTAFLWDFACAKADVELFQDKEI